jgi:hypothetical protein
MFNPQPAAPFTKLRIEAPQMGYQRLLSEGSGSIK